MRSPLARDRRPPPGFIRPCQPVLAEEVPTGDGWMHELKHDGFRIVDPRFPAWCNSDPRQARQEGRTAAFRERAARGPTDLDRAHSLASGRIGRRAASGASYRRGGSAQCGGLAHPPEHRL
jgi:hypothetical protein